MGLRSQIRSWLVANGKRVPDFLIRPHDRLFYQTVNALRPGMVVVDIGANRGDVARAFAARGATVHAFEPNPDIFPELEQAAQEYPGIRPHLCAVLDCDTEMKLYLHRDYSADPHGHSESSSLLANKVNVSETEYRTVPVRDIATIISEIGLPVDILKMDVEGAEYQILDRMIDSGAIEKVGMLLVEPHGDRVPGLAEAHARMLAKIESRKLGGKVRFDWA